MSDEVENGKKLNLTETISENSSKNPSKNPIENPDKGKDLSNRLDPKIVIDDEIKAYCKAFADDIELLKYFHLNEVNEQVLLSLAEDEIGNYFSLVLKSDDAIEAYKQINSYLQDIDKSNIDNVIDELKAEYSKIYLNYNYRASPSESPWFDDDGLVCQKPMFEVREYYNKYGLKAKNWRVLADDHIVSELDFIIYIAQRADLISLNDLANFMDEHILRWIGEFASQVKKYSKNNFYTGLLLISSVYLNEFRDYLELKLGYKRKILDIEKKQNIEELGELAKYMPGMEPSI